MSAVRCYDVRAEHVVDPHSGAEKLVRGKVVIRRPEDIDSICLHQTAVTFGVHASQVRAAKGDRELAQFMRAKRVHAHVTAFDEGAFVAAYPLRHYVRHGNGANARSIGLEIEGLFNGVPGGKRSEPSGLLIEAARAACAWIVEAAQAEGITIRYVLAHRQYSSSRGSDPGWAIWQRVAIEHCEHGLGLRSIPGLTDRTGRPIPVAWDPRQAAADSSRTE